MTERVSAWEIVNLREIEDSAQTEGVEARFARKHLASRDLGVSLFFYGPNFRSPVAHSHREQEEAYVVVEGSGRVRLDGQVRELSLWDVLRVAPEVVRAFEGGPHGIGIIAIGGPKPEGGDGVRSDALWPDQ